MRRVARLGLVLTVVVAAVWMLRPTTDPEPLVGDLQRIAPGTIIDTSPPTGWSHLVVKSQPSIRESERAKVNALTARTAGWMFTAFVADVRNGRLRTVALGLGCRANGHDVIVTPETAETYGADIGWITRTVLAKGYERQAQAAIVARSPTFALVDTPVWFRTGDSHRLVRFRYALLVGDGDTLDVLVWSVGADGPPSAVRLGPNTLDPAELVVDANQIVLGIPAEAAFAVDRLPPGRPLDELPTSLQPLATQDVYTPNEARKLEAAARLL